MLMDIAKLKVQTPFTLLWSGAVCVTLFEPPFPPSAKWALKPFLHHEALVKLPWVLCDIQAFNVRVPHGPRH